MKKSFLLAIISVLVFSLLAFSGSSATNTHQADINDLSMTFDLKTKAYSITDCNTNAAGEIIIPDTYNSYPITKIGDNAFKDCDSLTSIVLNETITNIGECAFMNCSSLESIGIPESVQSIGYYAFYNCKNLSKVKISNLHNWCKIAFSYEASNPLLYAEKLYLNDKLVTDLVITEDIAYVYDYAFYNCKSIKSITFSDKTTYIGKQSFSLCENLTSVDFGNGVAVIDEGAFRNCKSLSEIKISKSLAVSGYGAFLNCTSLTDVYIESLKNWCDITFNYEASNPLLYAENIYVNGEIVDYIIVPSGVTAIKPFAFCCNEYLNTFFIPETVTEISPEFCFGKTAPFIVCYENTFAEGYASGNSIDYSIVNIMPTYNSVIDYENKFIVTNDYQVADVEALFTSNLPATYKAENNTNAYTYYGTGSEIELHDGLKLVDTYIIINAFDLNGDSVCNVLDASLAERCYADNVTLEPAQIYAATGDPYADFTSITYQTVVNVALSSN